MPSAPSFQSEFAAFAGSLAESLSFNRSLGQIYGFLYVSTGPMSLGDIALGLGMSKGNASINLRTLESWGAVRLVPAGSTRQNHYQANTELRSLALRRIQEGVGRRLALAQESLARIEGKGPGDPAVRKRVESLKGMVSSARKALDALPALLKFLPG